MLYLFILPFAHTVALRLTCLTLLLVLALYSWYRGPVPKLPLKLPIALIAIYTAASLYWTVNLDYSLGEVKNEIGYTFVAFFTFFVFTNSLGRLKIFIISLATGAGVVACIALYSYHQKGLWDNTAYSGMVHDFAAYVVFIAPIIAFAFFIAKSWPVKLAMLVIAAICITAGYYTLQRQMWPALAMELIVLSGLLLYPAKWRPWKKLVIAATFIICAASIVPIGIVIKNEIPWTEPQKIAEVVLNDVRPQQIWVNSWKAIEQRPWFGAGFGRRIFYMAYPDLRVYMGWHAHNIFLNRWIQLGVVGIVLMLMVFAAIFWHFWQFYRTTQNRQLQLVGAFGLTFVIGVISINIFNDSMVRHFSLLFWSLMGMWLGYGTRINNGREHASCT